MPRYEHMPWCVDVHEDDGTCLLVEQIGDAQYGCRVFLTGTHCDSQQLQLEGMVVTDEEVAALLNAINELRTPFLAGLPASDCDLHYHNFDANYNDHVEGCPALWERCPSCGDVWNCDVCNNMPTTQCQGECLP